MEFIGNNEKYTGTGQGVEIQVNPGSEYATVLGGSGRDTVNIWGKYLYVDAGAGNDNITFANDAENVTAYGGAGNDTIAVFGEKSTIYGGKGNDEIRVWQSAKNIAVFGDEGNDYIYVHSDAENVTVNGGAGNDTIDFWAPTGKIITTGSDHTNTLGNVSALIVQGSGSADKIYVNTADYATVANTTIIGGKGNDTLCGTKGSDVFLYANGDGNDIIENYGGEDTIRLTSGSIKSYSVNRADLVLNIGSGSITVKNAGNRAVTIVDAKGKKTTKIYGTAGGEKTVIQKLMKSLDNTGKTGVSALDEAIRSATPYKSTQEAINFFLADAKNVDSDRFLADYCGIVLDDADTGAISGWDAGGLAVKTSESIVPESGSFQSFYGTKFTKRGLTITVPSGSRTSGQQTVINGLYTWWVEEALKLIEDSFGLSMTEKGADNPGMELNFVNNLGYAATANNIGLNINMSGLDLSDTTTSGGKEGSYYLDRVLAHEFTHSVMTANIKNMGEMPVFFVEGSAELTHGADIRKDDIESLLNDQTALARCLNVNNRTDYSDLRVYSAGFMFLRYLARQSALPMPDGVSYNSDRTKVTIKSPFSDTWDAGQYTSTVTTIDASKATKAVTIRGGTGANTIIAGSGGGLFSGGKGKDTLYGGAGNDVFSYASGDGRDTIVDYNAKGKDTLKITSGSISKTALSSNKKDITFTVGGGSITLKNAASKTINLADTRGSYALTKQKTLTLDKGFSGTMDATKYLSTITTINASKATKAVNVTGNAKANTIKAGKGGGTLKGGKGNDTITGGAGKDTFYYTNGDGNDTIKNYTPGKDIIQLGKSTTIKNVTVSGNDVRLNIGSGYISLVGMKGQKLTIVNANGKKTTKTYTASTSKAAAKVAALPVQAATSTVASGASLLMADADAAVIGRDIISDIYVTMGNVAAPAADAAYGNSISNLPVYASDPLDGNSAKAGTSTLYVASARRVYP